MEYSKPRSPEISNARRQELDEQYSIDPADYFIFSKQEGHVPFEGSGRWTMDYVAQKYIQSTDKVVGMMDGSIEKRALVDPDNPERSQQAPDVVVYLDKSARPVQWFAKEFWDQLATKQIDENGQEQIAKRPEEKFLNIDRANWFYRGGQNEGGLVDDLRPINFDIDSVSEDDILGIRAVFAKGELSEENWQQQVLEQPNALDGKNILIIDEVGNSGSTLSIAQQLLKRAFPDATVSGNYFWDSVGQAVGNTGRMQMGISPVWYDPTESGGRGIGEQDPLYYEQAYAEGKTGLRQKLGQVALSTPFLDNDRQPAKDPMAEELRREIKQMSKDFHERKILYRPATDRMRGDDYDLDGMLERQGLSFADYIYLRDKVKK